MSSDRGLREFVSRTAHSLLNAIGLEVRLVRNVRSANAKQRGEREVAAWRVLGHHDFGVILDIGSNEGQFALIARKLWPAAHVHSFEPLPSVYEALVEKFRDDPHLTAHNIGLSDRQGAELMHQSAFSPSSSLLPMAALHREEWPQSVQHTDVSVRLERLDDWTSANNQRLEFPLLIKIDVQGFELAVINGGIDTLRSAALIVVEVSFYELYEGQPLFGQIHDRLNELGFIYCGNIEQYCNKEGNRVLFADAIFENTASKLPYD